MQDIINKLNCEYYQDDLITFLNCDCEKFMELIPDKYFNLAICDPPYGLERFKKGGSVINKYGDENRLWNNIKPKKEYFNKLFNISLFQIIWGANNFILPESEYFIIWDKINPENFSFAMCEMAYTNIKKPAKIFRINSMQLNRINPCQKPLELYEWLLDNYAKKDDLIFDSHVGSASSLIACMKKGFKVVGCELDKDYFNDAVKRIKLEKAKLNNNFYIPESENSLFNNL